MLKNSQRELDNLIVGYDLLFKTKIQLFTDLFLMMAHETACCVVIW